MSSQILTTQIAISWSVYVGVAFQLLRIKLDITQNEVAARLSSITGDNITQSYVSKIEQQKAHVSLERLGAYCLAVEAHPETVVNWAITCATNARLSDREALKKLLDDDKIRKEVAQLHTSLAETKAENSSPVNVG